VGVPRIGRSQPSDAGASPAPVEPPKPAFRRSKLPSTANSPSGLGSRPRTGLKALKARVKVRGLAVIDKRTLAARHLLDWRKEMIADLGGEQAVSAQQMALVEMATRTRLYIDHADAHLMEQSNLITRRGRLKPLVEQRQRLVDSLARILGQLGLERRAKPAKSLDAYLAEKYSPRPAPEGTEPQSTPPAAAPPARA
jgi:hypothetical protein